MMLDHILVVVSRFLCTCGGRDCWQCWFIAFWFRLGFFIVCFFHCLAKSQPKNYQLGITAQRRSVCYSFWGQGGEKSSNCAHTVGIHNALLILILASATTSAKKPACCIHSILAGLIQET